MIDPVHEPKSKRTMSIEGSNGNIYRLRVAKLNSESSFVKLRPVININKPFYRIVFVNELYQT